MCWCSACRTCSCRSALVSQSLPTLLTKFNPFAALLFLCLAPSMASQTPSHQDQDLTIKNAVLEVPDKMPKRVYPYENMDITGYVESFNKYEADYTRWLKAKYFSDKDIYGGDIFEEKITPNGFTVKASRWSGMKSYANPASFADQSSVGRSAPAAETPADVSKERQLTKKNG